MIDVCFFTSKNQKMLLNVLNMFDIWIWMTQVTSSVEKRNYRNEGKNGRAYS